MGNTLVWFRKDLRLDDHPALAEAISAGEHIIPCYLWAPQEEGNWAPGEASNWWLHHALSDLHDQLREVGLKLITRDARQSSSLHELVQLAEETHSDTILWSRRYEPAIIKRDADIKAKLRGMGFRADSFNSGMLFEPHEIASKSGKPFQVFTPMWKHYQTLTVKKPVRVDLSNTSGPKKWPKSLKASDLPLLSSLSWDKGFQPFWSSPSRSQLKKQLQGFIKSEAESYPNQRNLPALDGTSRLSPYLHFGQIGPREAWSSFATAKNYSESFKTGVMRQLVWREFGHHLLSHFPHTTETPLRKNYLLFPWDHNETFIRSWQQGETGYPIVDAGMRQLWQTGWMHNRVRMIVGSLLVKHLLQHWSEGARWFWDTLVDADLANNTMGWQWIGGCGADAAPYFRIFNPITQGEKFCLLYTSPSPRDRTRSRMPSSA